MSDETIPARGELVEEDGRTKTIETDIVPPEDPPEITGRNYTMTTTTYSWDDASDGDTHYVNDDNAAYIMIPFEFEYYGQTYLDLIITDNGMISFTSMNTAPTGSYPSGESEDWFSIAPFWTDLASAGNVYTKYFTAPSRFVIQYDNINYEAGGFAGTFQLVLFEWGDIEFRYNYLQDMADYTVGLNYGYNTSFYNTYTFGVDPVSNLALRFEYVNRFVFITSEYYSSSSDYTLTWTARSNVTIDNYHIFVNHVYDGSTSSMSYPLSGMSETWTNFKVWMETDGVNITYDRDVYFDWTQPTVTIDYPLNDTTLTDGKVNWSASDTGSLTHIEILVDHVLYQTLEWYESETYILAENGQWHNITIVAYDESMNIGTDNVTIYYERTNAAVGIITSHGENDLWAVRDLYLALGHIVVTIDQSLTGYDLNLYDVILVGSSSFLWPSSDVTALDTYLSNGGILVTVGDAGLSPSVKTILESYGIEFTDEQSWIDDYTINFDASHPLMTGVSSLYLMSLDNMFDISFPAFELFSTDDGAAEFGIVVELAETKILSIGYGFDFFLDQVDNSLLFENIIDYWLTVDTHDLRASVGEPDTISIATPTDIEVHVINNGLSTETSFTLEMWVDDSLESSMVVTSLDSGEWATLSAPVVITYTGTINVTAYVAPVTGETNAANNKDTKFLYIYEFTIISPIDMETVQGGLVWVNYTCTNIAELETITGFLNGEEIIHSESGLMFGSGEIIVPVFENGTNYITLVGTWSNGFQANASVSVNSQYVCPLVNPNPGDYYEFELEMSGGSIRQYFNFTFGEWVSEFEVNCTMKMGMFDGADWLWMGTWTVTNVLNGYVSEVAPGTSPALDYTHRRLMVIPCFLSPEVMPYSTTIDVPAFSRAEMGMKTCWMDWTLVFTVEDIGSWRGYETLILTCDFPGAEISMSVLSCTGMLVHMFQDMGLGGTATGNLEITNMLPPSDRAPIVNHPDDINLEEVTDNFSINWVASGNYPTIYRIYVNGVAQQASWYAGQNIWLNGTNLNPGLNNCSIVLYDNNGQFTMDTVMVIIPAVTTTTTTTNTTSSTTGTGFPPDLMNLIIIGGLGGVVIIIVIVIIMRKK